MKLGSLYIVYDPETKEQSREWKFSSSPCSEFKTRKWTSKLLASVFWDKDGILLVYYLEKGASIMANYCVALLDKLKQQLVSKRWGKLSKGIFVSSRKCCSSQGGHYAPGIGRSSLWRSGTLGLLTDLAPLDYYFFPNFKKHLEGRMFLCTEKATLAVDGWFAAQPEEFIWDGLKKLRQLNRVCVCVCVCTRTQSHSLLFSL
jgi:hypothetical protein